MSLHRKIVSGAVWSFVEKGGQQGLAFVVFLILARLLGPEEYGLANLCFVYFTLATMVIMGLADGIVSLQVGDDLRLSSLFWSLAGIGLGLGALCIVTAAPLAAFMDEPRLAGLLTWFSVIPVLVAGAAVPNLLILKDLDFRTYAMRTLAATIVGGGVGVGMAYRGLGAYAIVGQQIAFFAIANIMVWRKTPWRPRAMYSFAAFRAVAAPGVGVMSSNALGFLDGQAPRFLIAKLLGGSALGYFAMATRLRFALTEIFVTSPLAVVYPALARLRDRPEDQRKLALTINFFGNLAIFPLLAIAAATAPEYVPLVFGAKWTPAIPVLQLYIVGAAASPTFVVVQQVFRANNKMRESFRINGVFVAVNLSMTLFLLRDDGLAWMAGGIAAATMASLPIYVATLKRCVGISLWSIFPSLGLPFIGATLAFVTTWALRDSTLIPSTPWASLFSLVFAGAATYAAFCLLFQYRKIRNTLGIVSRSLRST